MRFAPPGGYGVPVTQKPHFGRTWEYRFLEGDSEVHRETLADDSDALRFGVELRRERRLKGDLRIERRSATGWEYVGTEGRTKEA